MNKINKIKPKKLKRGDTIGIISPAGAVDNQEQWLLMKNYFINKGYSVKIALHAKDSNGYLAGLDENRANDLMDMFEDKSIDAILCARGGYGTYRILPKIDFEIIKRNPKIFVGYSDITALLNTFTYKSDMVTFHGPLATPDFGSENIFDYTEAYFFDVLEGKLKTPYSYTNILDYHCINAGEAQGQLIGGNLTIFAGMLGTPYFPDVKGKILLLEDVGEPLYKIDRLIMQLKLSGVLDQISGLLFSEFTSMIQSELNNINKTSPIDIIKELTAGLDIPIGYGFPASHRNNKVTLPFGVEYYFNSKDFQLSIMEDYLS